MSQPVPVLHHTIVVVDVEGYTDPARTELHQDVVRQGLYRALQTAFTEAELDYATCTVEDRGDGALILVPATVPAGHVVERLPHRLVAALQRHNAACAPQASIRLRMALHAGQVRTDPNGQGGAAVILACRLIDAPALREALRESTGVLAGIVSAELYRDVVRQDPAAAPELYRRVDVEVKNTRATAWVRAFDHGTRPAQVVGHDGTWFSVVDALLAVPSVRSEDGRRTVLELLRPEIANAVPHNARPRLHVVGILRTCLDYDGGVEELIAILRQLEGDSNSVRRVAESVRDMLTD